MNYDWDPKVWCTHKHTLIHVLNDFPRFRNFLYGKETKQDYRTTGKVTKCNDKNTRSWKYSKTEWNDEKKLLQILPKRQDILFGNIVTNTKRKVLFDRNIPAKFVFQTTLCGCSLCWWSITGNREYQNTKLFSLIKYWNWNSINNDEGSLVLEITAKI